MIKNFHPLTDQGYRRLVQTAVYNDGTILIDPPPGRSTEMIHKIVRGSTETMHLAGKTGRRSLTGSAVYAAVIFMFEPYSKGLVDFLQSCPLKAWQKAGSHCFKKPLDFPFALWRVWPCMYE